MSDGGPRLDKWLWFARFFKSRTLAGAACSAGKIRVNGAIVKKAHYTVKLDDVLTFAQGEHIRTVRVVNLGARRGPAPEARTLYDDLAPPPDKAAADATEAKPAPVAQRDPGSGRPTKADRRALEKWIDQD